MKKKILNIITNPLFSGSAIMIIGSNLINVLTYLYHLMMGRILGPSFYGELSALISFIGLLAIVPISLSLVIVKYVSSAKSKRETEGLIKWLRSNGFKASIIISIIIVMISPAVTTFLRINKSSYIIL